MAEQLQPSPKKARTAAQQAANKHLQPNAHNLRAGGKKPREFLTPIELDFCSFYAQTGRITLAGRYAGIPQNQTTQIYKRPLVQKTIAEFVAKFKNQALTRDAQRLEERKEVTHREYVHRMQTMKTHKYRGDDAIAKMCEIGFKSTGEIQATRITAQASAGATANAATTLQVYESQWLVQKRQQMAQQLEQKYPDGPPSA